MEQVRLVRAIIAVHRYRLGFAIVLAGLVAMPLLGNFTVQRLGLILLIRPVSPVILLTSVVAIGTTVALSGLEMTALPANRRYFVSQAFWFVSVTFAAIIAALITVKMCDIAGASQGAIARNVLLYVSLSVPFLAAGKPELTWLIPILLPGVAAQFGQYGNGDSYSWWAVTIDPLATPTQLTFAVTLSFLALVLYSSAPIKCPDRLRPSTV